MKRLLSFIIKNKLLLIFLLVFYIIMVYTHSQTFIISDDLAYSFFFRTETRVTSLFQIIQNQIYDYSHYNSRVIIHFFVQFLLMFGKKVWIFINPLILIFGIIYSAKIVEKLTKKNLNFIYLITIGTSALLLIANLKYLVYWVAGSVNYIWVYSFSMFVVYHCLKNGLNNKKITPFLILIMSLLHEVSFVFSIIFIIGWITKDTIINKKFNKKNMVYISIIIISALFILFSPGNQYRTTINGEWNSLTLLSKLQKSIPEVSKLVFGLFDKMHILSTVYFCSVLIGISKFKKKKTILTLLLITVAIISFLTCNGWIYFMFGIILFFLDIYQSIKEKKYDLVYITISFYATAFFMVLTSEYYAGRPNYFIYLYFGIVSCIRLNEIQTKKVIFWIKNIIIFVFVFLVVKEIKIYKNIGEVSKQRLIAINNVKKGKTNILYAKKIREDYYRYHIDLNAPNNSEYWAYNFYLNYYGLDKNTIVEIIN